MTPSSNRGPIGLVLHGASGRMGRAIASVARDLTDVTVEAHLEHREEKQQVVGSGARVVGRVPTGPGQRVVLDFSQPAAIPGLVRSLDGTATPLVSGTTGLGPTERKLLERYSEVAAVFSDSNMSYGIAVVRHLVREAARLVKREAEVEIVDTHHRWKRDVPSGTALSLKDAIDPDVPFRVGRVDSDEARVHVHSLRLGNVAGDHAVHFGLEDEVVTVSHRAISREVFARGAIRAARFVVDKPPGLYGMRDLLQEQHA